LGLELDLVGHPDLGISLLPSTGSALPERENARGGAKATLVANKMS
jgi:hypothetical protein